MAQPVNGDHRDAARAAMAAEDIVHRRVIDLGADEDGGVCGTVLDQLGELNDRLPVDLDFTHRRAVFRRLKTAISFVVPCLVDG